MLEPPAVPFQPPSYSLRTKASSHTSNMSDDEGDCDTGNNKSRAKSRRELPAGAVETLKAWLLSPEHFTHPYPTPQDQAMLMEKTGIDKKQLKNWFTNARRRIWKPMLKKQIEQGKLTAPGVAPSSMENPHSVQAMRVHYQQAIQDQVGAATAMVDGSTFVAPAVYPKGTDDAHQPNQGQFYDPTKVQNSSINTLAQVSSSAQINKTDSHAVLMELFARDQDLVRQATESAKLKAADPKQQQPPPPTLSQHPMLKASSSSSSSVLHNVPTLNSWPHFSSITSLNNLGTLPGVKSIASLSGQDLASKGNVNKMGNLAQVKSMESMGKNDSYAFLEVFFGDRSSTNLNGMGGSSRGRQLQQPQEEDNEIGLSLDDEAPSSMISSTTSSEEKREAGMTTVETNTGTLKRAYDDALAAEGLLSVSRSCEKLTELPAKMQRALSQECFSKRAAQQQQQQQPAVVSYNGDTEVKSTTTTHDGHIQVSCSTLCALCSQPNIDTQLRPCGHMFHERCLKPSLTNPMGPPKCPLDDIPIHSAVLAVPEKADG